MCICYVAVVMETDEIFQKASSWWVSRCISVCKGLRSSEFATQSSVHMLAKYFVLIETAMWSCVFFVFTSCCTRSSKHSLFGRGVNESVHHGMLLWWTVVDASLLLRSLFQGIESSRVCWLLKLISHSKKWGCLETHQAFHMYQQPSSLCWYCPGQRGYRSCGS